MRSFASLACILIATSLQLAPNEAQSFDREKLKRLREGIASVREKRSSESRPSIKPETIRPISRPNPPVVVNPSPSPKPPTTSRPTPSPPKPRPIQVDPAITERITPRIEEMVSILQGRIAPGSNGNEPSIKERVITLDPTTPPQGGMVVQRTKQGRTPAEGIDDRVTTPPAPGTFYIKSGRTRPEGEAVSVTRVKDGRETPGGAPLPGAVSPRPDTRHNPESSGSVLGESLSQHLATPGNASPGSGGHSAAPRLSYRVDETAQLSTNTIRFIRGSTDLADEASYYYLRNLAAALKSPELATDSFVVEGHASADGAAPYNLTLSQRRANAIFAFLVNEGVSPDQLFAVGHGETQARFGTHEPEYLRAQDRQVIVFRLAD